MTPEENISLPQEVINSLKGNKILRKTLKNMIHRLLHQFRSQSYDINAIISQERQIVENKKQKVTNDCKQKQRSDETKNSQNHQQLKRQILELEMIEKYWMQLSIFVWQLGCSPKCYVEMFENEQIHAQQTQVIDMHIFTSKIYRRVMKKAKQFTSLTNLFEEIAADQIYFFLQEVSAQICIAFSQSRKIIFNELEKTTEIVQKSNIINFYVLFKIFKDLSVYCKQAISSLLEEGIFRNVQPSVVVRFANYIIKKYEILELEMNKQKQQQLPELSLEKKNSLVDQLMTNQNSIKWREAIGQDGEVGIMIEIDEPESQTQTPKRKNYMIMLDQEGQIKIMHCNSLYKKWQVCQKAQKNYDIINLVKNQKALAAKLRSTQPRDQVYKMTMIDNIGMFGGTMGRTLAEVDQFKNAGQFIAVLSKRMVVGGSLNYMISTVPLLGYIFITGGYTYSFYYIFSNKYSNKNKKLRQLRNMTIGVAGAVGSGIVGAAIGQTLIPVPILGAFIGGFVGGFIGQLGGRTVTTILQSAKFNQTIQKLDKTLNPNGYWEVNSSTLKILEINKQKFYETIPEGLQHKMNCDRIWMTLIFFTLFTFSQSQKRVKFLNKKLKQMKKKENFQIVQQEYEMGSQDQYQPSLNILCVMTFLQENQIYYLQFHDRIAYMMEKMFARIKS